MAHRRQVCFRVPEREAEDAARPAQPSGGAVPPGLRFGSRQAEALAEVLQVFACGEESAALAFAHLAGSSAEAVTSAALSVIADEETAHEGLLRGLREALPEPRQDPGLGRALVRFYGGLGQPEAGRHLAGIASLDSAVCGIVAALLRDGAPVALEPRVSAVFGRIRREEAGHVRLSRGLARDLAGRGAAEDVAERTRSGLVDVLALRGAEFDLLGVDPDRLFAHLRRTPSSLFA